MFHYCHGFKPWDALPLPLFFPPNVSLWESQLGHTNLRFSGVLSDALPLMWSSHNVIGLSIHSVNLHLQHDRPSLSWTNIFSRRRLLNSPFVYCSLCSSYLSFFLLSPWHELLQYFGLIVSLPQLAHGFGFLCSALWILYPHLVEHVFLLSATEGYTSNIVPQHSHSFLILGI